MFDNDILLDTEEEGLTQEEIAQFLEEHDSEILEAILQAEEDEANGDNGRDFREVFKELSQRYRV